MGRYGASKTMLRGRSEQDDEISSLSSVMASNFARGLLIADVCPDAPMSRCVLEREAVPARFKRVLGWAPLGVDGATWWVSPPPLSLTFLFKSLSKPNCHNSPKYLENAALAPLVVRLQSFFQHKQ